MKIFMINNNLNSAKYGRQRYEHFPEDENQIWLGIGKGILKVQKTHSKDFSQRSHKKEIYRKLMAMT